MIPVVSIDADKFVADLKTLGQTLERVANQVVHDAAVVAKRSADRTDKYEDKTGTLRRGTRVEFVPSSMSSAIVNTTFHAEYIEDGTDPHPIVARRVKDLYFWWEREQVWFKGPIVKHPGTQARPFFKAAGEVGGHHLERGMQRAVRERVRAFNQGA